MRDTTSFETYERQVMAWIAEWGRISEKDIQPDSRIEGPPLRITGDDVRELLLFLEERSGVDFGEFEFVRHFNSEAGSLYSAIMRWRGKWPPLTLGTVRTLSEYMFSRRA